MDETTARSPALLGHSYADTATEPRRVLATMRLRLVRLPMFRDVPTSFIVP